ncbi:LppM family (lipo)protein [Propionibacteriaceae bacterium Y1700]|uniref:LppM family (lipo)protein n=1 Tax=Microlunatus sp. Y1700 TaxID=3418487 RepID=UPI003DA73417
MKFLRALLAGVACLLLLTGCFKVDADYEISSDDTLSGSMIFGFSKELPEAEAKQAMEQMQKGLPAGVKVEPWENEKFRGIEATYDKVPLSEFQMQTAGDTSGMGLRREGDYFVLGDKNAEQSAPLTMSGYEYEVTFTFPGEVEDANGVIDGNTVTWTDPNVTPYAKAKASGGLLVPILIGVAVVVLLAAGGGAAYLLIRRNKKAGQQQGGGYDPTAFGGAQPDNDPFADQPGQQGFGPQQGFGAQQQGGQPYGGPGHGGQQSWGQPDPYGQQNAPAQQGWGQQNDQGQWSQQGQYGQQNQYGQPDERAQWGPQDQGQQGWGQQNDQGQWGQRGQ